MGDFRMTIEAMGGHGCDRKAKAGATAQDGDIVRGCGQETCPDCMFARFVSEMQRAGMRPFVATLHHWPADMNEHLFLPDAEKCSRCNRTKAEIAAHEEKRAADPTGHLVPSCGRMYRPESEVVDDYSERDVKYPTGAFTRATARRVKGAF